MCFTTLVNGVAGGEGMVEVEGCQGFPGDLSLKLGGR